MKTEAAVLYEMGRPRPYRDSRPLVIETVELEGPGPGEVLVEIVAAGLCHSDLSVIDGSRPRVMPMVLGHEAAGIVREVGEGVYGVAPGDRVICSFVPMCGRCIFCASGRAALCERGNHANRQGTLLSGAVRFRNAQGQKLHHHLGVSAFSRYTVVAQESLIRIDPDIPLEKAALFGCAVITGVGAVVHTARVSPGSSVAIFGLGGVGLSAVMGAQLVGAYPIIAVDILPAKLELARHLGATHTINAAEADPVQAIHEHTRGGVDYALEAVGSERVLRQAYEATRQGGTTVAVGLPHPERLLQIPAVGIVAGERTIKGSYMGSASPRRDLPWLLGLYRAGKLPVELLVSRKVHLEQLNEAFDALASGEVVRQVLVFSS
jgi:alcohol dehydrogenase